MKEAFELEQLHVQRLHLVLAVLVRMRERRTEASHGFHMAAHQVLLHPQQLPILSQQLPLLLLCLVEGGATCGRRS